MPDFDELKDKANEVVDQAKEAVGSVTDGDLADKAKDALSGVTDKVKDTFNKE